MTTEDSDDSGSSKSVESPTGTAATPRQHSRKLEVFDEVLRSLRNAGSVPAHLSSFEDELWAHFNRLPARYALDVNVERPEEVLTHIRLLEMAMESRNGPVFDVRIVQVHTVCEGTSSDVQFQGEQDSSSYFSRMSMHPPPAFGSSQSLETLALEANKSHEDRDEIVDENLLVPRAMHEITFAADDRPKLLSQLTLLLGEIGLNIQEAHIYSTNDGYSLDVVVVQGWRHEEMEQLRLAIQNEILKLEKQPLSKRDQFPILLEEAQSGENFPFSHVEIPKDEIDVWEIDIRRLKFEKKVASGSYGELYRGTYYAQDVAIKVLNPDVDMQWEFAQKVYIMQLDCFDFLLLRVHG